MNIAIVRRAIWLVAALALACAVFAFYEARWTELFIAFGALPILAIGHVILADTERQRRLPPHGPVRKFGYREVGDRR